MPSATFFYDLGSPYAYLTAERLREILPGEVAWQPISLGAVFKATGRSSWAQGDEPRRRDGIAEVESRARRYGLPGLCWPELWPSNYLMAMRAATFASGVGRGREFALAAFRHAFQHGRDLGVPEEVLAAAGAAGLSPEAVARATGDPEIKLALRETTDAALQLGVMGVPTIAVGSELFWGDDRLEHAAEFLAAAAG